LEDTCGTVFAGGQVCPRCGGSVVTYLSVLLGQRRVVRFVEKEASDELTSTV
jgi:hypothetical protein